jgi:hypothetical protein
MAKKQSYLKRKQKFSGAQVLFFGLAFAAIGSLALLKTFAAGAGSCVQKTPGISVDNNYGWSQWGSWGMPGQQLKYAVHVVNYDTGCATSSFSVSATAADGYSVSIPVSTISLKATTQGYIWAYVTSPTTAADGDSPVTFSLTRSGTSAGSYTTYYKVYSSDTTAPILYWNNPYDGQVINSKGKGASPFNVTVESNDNHAVKKIDTYIDGALVHSASCDNIAYSCDTYYAWSLRGEIGQHTVMFKSYDWLNNVGTVSASFSVN